MKKIAIFSNETLIVFTGGKFILLNRNLSLGERKGAGWRNDQLSKIDQLCQAGWTEFAERTPGRRRRGTEAEGR